MTTRDDSRSGASGWPARWSNGTYESDEDIAAGLEAREEDALREMMSRYGPYVFGMTSRVCRDRDLAEAAAREALLVLWMRPRLYDPTRGGLKALVVSIARHKAIDLVRREQGTRRLGDPLEADHLQAQGHPSRPGCDRGVKLEWALARLTPGQRDAISLAYFGGRTCPEVADELDIPEGTAKTRIRDGLMGLRRLLVEAAWPDA